MFRYQRPGSEVLDQLAGALEQGGWPVARAAGKVTTSRGDRSYVATASGDTIIIDAIEAAPPADARPPRPPPLAKPPPNWPPAFPFIAGGIPETVRGAPAGAVGLLYPGKSAAKLAAALRARAQRRQWMCTQEPLEFVCAGGAGSVDVRISDRRDGTRLLVIGTSR